MEEVDEVKSYFSNETFEMIIPELRFPGDPRCVDDRYDGFCR
jgi:hypothetical protein